jgi:hypothetical protein
MVAHAYVEFVRCCYILGQRLVERSRSNKAQSSHVSEPYDCTEVLKCDLSLEDWFHSLPETLKCDVDSWKFLDQQSSGAVRIYSLLLMGMYLASHIVLHLDVDVPACDIRLVVQGHGGGASSHGSGVGITVHFELIGF